MKTSKDKLRRNIRKNISNCKVGWPRSLEPPNTELKKANETIVPRTIPCCLGDGQDE